MIDIEQIYEIIPKKTQEWTHQDVQKWLLLNEMNSCLLSFKQQLIDGHQLVNLTPQLLKNKLKISSHFIIKRVLQWVTNDRFEFDHYVEENQPQQNIKQKDQNYHQKENNSERQSHIKRQLNVQGEQLIIKKEHINPLKQSQIANKQGNYVKFINSQYIHRKSKIILSYDKVIVTVTQSSKIGRQNTNQIVLSDDSVSRNHAEIVKKGSQFYLKDIGSKFGSFIEIKERLIVVPGKVYQMGTSQLIIKSLKLYKNNSGCVFDINIKLVGSQTNIALTGKTSIVIGKKSKDISINDEQLSNQHCKLFLKEQNLWIQSLQGDVYERLIKDNLINIIDDKKYRFGGLNIRMKVQQSCGVCNKIVNKCQCK